MKSNSYRKALSGLVCGLVYLSATATIAILGFLLAYIVIHGAPYLTKELFSWKYTSENVSMLPAIINTIQMTFITLLVAVPLGIASAIYLVEYEKKESRLVVLIRITTETLAGIPSIIYGLFGLLFFVTKLKWGYSMLAGALTLAIMVLPLIIRTAEEALLAVPNSYREASLGLGAGKLRTIVRIVLPSAIPGIIAGVILSIGRTVGETAALVYTAGTVAQISGLMGSGRTLAVHMYSLSREGLYINQAHATALVLLLLVMGINAVSGFTAKRIKKR